MFLEKKVILRLFGLQRGNNGNYPLIAIEEQFVLQLLVIPETNSDALGSLEF